MGTEHAKNFLLHIEAHTELQTKLAAAQWNPEFISDFASELGYRFSSHDFQSAIDSMWGSLSEEELLNVAGGGGDGNGNGNGGGNGNGNGNGGGNVHTSVNPDSNGNGNGGGGIHNPNIVGGDVSGNSCFFGRGRR